MSDKKESKETIVLKKVNKKDKVVIKKPIETCEMERDKFIIYFD